MIERHYRGPAFYTFSPRVGYCKCRVEKLEVLGPYGGPQNGMVRVEREGMVGSQKIERRYLFLDQASASLECLRLDLKRAESRFRAAANDYNNARKRVVDAKAALLLATGGER